VTEKAASCGFFFAKLIAKFISHYWLKRRLKLGFDRMAVSTYDQVSRKVKVNSVKDCLFDERLVIGLTQ